MDEADRSLFARFSAEARSCDITCRWIVLTGIIVSLEVAKNGLVGTVFRNKRHIEQCLQQFKLDCRQRSLQISINRR